MEECFDANGRPIEVGCKVVVLDGSGAEKYYGGWVYSMNEYIGLTMTVRSAHGFQVTLDGARSITSHWLFDPRYLVVCDNDIEDNKDIEAFINEF